MQRFIPKDLPQHSLRRPIQSHRYGPVRGPLRGPVCAPVRGPLLALLLLARPPLLPAQTNREVPPFPQPPLPANPLEPSRNRSPAKGALPRPVEETILQNLRSAYPRRVESIGRRQGDWSITVQGQTFLWARGRLLPPEAAHQWREYEPYLFFIPPEPVHLHLTPEQETQLRQYILNRKEHPPTRHPGFFNALFSIRNRADTYREIKPLPFLGHTVHVHRAIHPHLRRVDQALQAARRDSPGLDQYLRRIRQIGGFHWRTIRSSNSRSMHSYGMALDIIPHSYGGKHVYWEWSRDSRAAAWYRVPPEDRYAPPQAVISALEREGFIWGGKWVLYDTIHFEYRPDMLVLKENPPVPAIDSVTPPRGVLFNK